MHKNKTGHLKLNKYAAWHGGQDGVNTMSFQTWGLLRLFQESLLRGLLLAEDLQEIPLSESF